MALTDDVNSLKNEVADLKRQLKKLP